MAAYRVLSVILGILVAISGIYLICAPGLVMRFIATIAAIAMIVEGVGSICKWNDGRKAGVSDTFTLVGGIISLVVGIIVLCGFFAQLLFDAILVYFIIIWVILVGIMRICASLKLRSAIKDNNFKNPKISWGWILAAGILLILCGVLCLVYPLIMSNMIGLVVGISVLVAGVGLITTGLSA